MNIWKNLRAPCLAGALGLVFTLGASIASADTLSGCSSCFGDTYTLTYSLVTDSTYHFVLDVGTSGYDGTGAFLNAVAVKVVADDSSLSNVMLLSYPSTGGSWQLSLAGLSANGCSTTAAAGFVCIGSTSNGVPVPDGTYEFDFNATVSASNLLTGTNNASVKALYVNSSGQQAGLTSNSITLQPGTVPEPTTVVLLGSSMIGIGAIVRRRRSRLAKTV
jgi:hypothetical protein